MQGVLSEMIAILVGGITGIAEGIGTGLTSLVTSIFLQTGAGGEMTLSAFGGVICIFGGIALAVGLSRMVVQWVRSLGN